MAIIIDDPALLLQLRQLSNAVEVRDPNGNYVGSFAPPLGKPPPGFVVPYTDDEMAARRLIREGKPLAEILKKITENQ